MSDDPWHGLTPSVSIGRINARRVGADDPWDFFWARDVEGSYLLVLEFADATGMTQRTRLPELRGIEVSILPGETPGSHLLVLRLLDGALRDPFIRLARDLIDGTRSAGSEAEAVQKAVAGLWRWHYLLRGGGSNRLSETEQQGLVGELLLLLRLLDWLPAGGAVSSWQGPLGSTRDFSVGRVGLESKTRRGAAAPFVIISSEHQLDDDGLDALFLVVVELDRAPATTQAAVDLSVVAQRVRDRVLAADPGAVEAFEEKLTAAGFRWEDEYADCLWIEGKTTFYLVGHGFPRIRSSDVMNGVLKVRYQVALVACAEHEVDKDFVMASTTPEAEA